jgi:hypothetical protein
MKHYLIVPLKSRSYYLKGGIPNSVINVLPLTLSLSPKAIRSSERIECEVAKAMSEIAE